MFTLYTKKCSCSCKLTVERDENETSFVSFYSFSSYFFLFSHSPLSPFYFFFTSSQIFFSIQFKTQTAECVLCVCVCMSLCYYHYYYSSYYAYTCLMSLSFVVCEMRLLSLSLCSKTCEVTV